MSYKSIEIIKALYWTQNSKTGKWESRSNTTRPYLGEGISVPNFKSIFIGEYSGYRYLFIDKFDYSWRYPALEKEWILIRILHAFELTDEAYARIYNIKRGEVITVLSNFHNEMFMGREDYSFPFYLELTNSLNGKYREEHTSHPIIIKRTTNNGSDVIRFNIYPTVPELIDFSYFELSYSSFMNLFSKDSSKTYKHHR